MKMITHHYGVANEENTGVTFVACAQNSDSESQFTLRVGVTGLHASHRYEMTEREAKQLRNFLNNYVPK